jgi:hypothetical protein
LLRRRRTTAKRKQDQPEGSEGVSINAHTESSIGWAVCSVDDLCHTWGQGPQYPAGCGSCVDRISVTSDGAPKPGDD